MSRLRKTTSALRKPRRGTPSRAHLDQLELSVTTIKFEFAISRRRRLAVLSMLISEQGLVLYGSLAVKEERQHLLAGENPFVEPPVSACHFLPHAIRLSLSSKFST